jgi:zinc protease
MNKIPAFILSACLLMNPAMGFAEMPALPQFPKLDFHPPKPERYVMPNGLIVYFFEDHDLPLIKIDMLFRTGTEYEPADKIGVSNIFADAWGQGGTTKQKPLDIARFLERKAAGIGFSMGLESASGSMSARTQDFPEVFRVFADLLLTPAFDKDYVDLAKARSLDALRRMNDDPEEIMRREFRRVMYGNDHPYARVASPDSIQHIKREDLLAWHAAYILPNNAFIAVSGDFKSADMKKTLAGAFGGWKSVPLSLPPIAPVIPVTTKRLLYAQRAINQTQIRVGYYGYARHSGDEFAWSVFNELWGGNATSRLFQTVRTQLGLAYAVGSASFIPSGTGILVAVSQTRGSQSIAATQAILKINAEIRHAPFTATEIQAAKDQLINEYLHNFATSEQCVSLYMSNEFYGFPADYLENYSKNIAKVTAADLVRVGEKYLKPEQSTILLIGDLSTFEKPIATLGKAQELLILDYNQENR